MAFMCCIHLEPNREMTVDEFKAWLRRFDVDHDGQISCDELGEALRSLHIWFGWWKARQGMKVADNDRNGHLNNSREIEKLVNYAQQHLYVKITKKGIMILVIVVVMYNNNNKNSSDHKKHNLGAPAPMNMNTSPRISFSTDFMESSNTCSNSRHQHLLNLPAASRPQAPGASDFEFSVSSYSMMSADELFSQGRLLPFKNNNKTAATLREELLTDDDDDNNNNNNNNGGVGSSRPPKSGSSGRWKGLLGLRKSHVGPKNSQREDQVQSTSQHFAGHNE